ncbi:alpha/beta hydrolase [Sulfitobacter sp. D35]|uniref:alpha/beta fold hydrolase n=1 Tax=Sulfitobacter sp. D35 TaxID=3083252 RepID=UPI00296F7960|nr:alpha/beta hydrolase [Sulfitobacter sp. D35]MDW4497898.1 alpha/beta hydrolase [Sulfitobacter sp. D35]
MLDITQAKATTPDGLSIAYDVQGQGDPILLIAGMSADRSLWSLVRYDLAERFRTIALDNRDAGASDCATTSYTATNLARDALAVLDSAGVERAHVLGHSLGGVIAQELAILAPDRVSRLTLANTFAANDHGTREHFALIGDLRDAVADDLTFLRALYFYGLGRSTLEHMPLSAVANQVLEGGPVQKPGALKRQIDVLLATSTLDRLGTIAVPTRVIWSSEDKFFSEAHSAAIVNTVDRAELVQIEKTGHCPMIEAPERFVAAVLD